MASLKAEPAPVARVGDGEEGEEVAADTEEDVQRVEYDGDARRAVGILSQKLIAVHTVTIHHQFSPSKHHAFVPNLLRDRGGPNQQILFEELRVNRAA